MKKLAQIVSFLLVAVMCVAIFASCAPASDPDKAMEALKENGYIAKKLGSEAADYEGVVACVMGSKGLTDYISILYFDSSSSAKDAWEKVEEDMKDEIKDGWVFERSGKMIYFGTEDAVKAAR